LSPKWLVLPMPARRPEPEGLSAHSSILARARAHFGAMIAVIEGLRAELLEVGERMILLQADYRSAIGPCRLLLYVRKDRDGVPRGLYWGKLFKAVRDGQTRKLVTHLPGRLNHSSIYWVALRWHDRELLRNFDKQRLGLNGERGRFALALSRAGRCLSLLQVLPHRQSPPSPPGEVDALRLRAWRLAWACASVEDDMAKLVRRQDVRPRAVQLFPYVTTGKHGYLFAGWAIPDTFRRGGRVRKGRRHVSSRLSGAILKSLRVLRDSWPALRAVDRQMRLLRREHQRYARAIGRVRRLRRALPSKSSSIESDRLGGGR
jgi:hypothetical protein